MYGSDIIGRLTGKIMLGQVDKQIILPIKEIPSGDGDFIGMRYQMPKVRVMAEVVGHSNHAPLSLTGEQKDIEIAEQTLEGILKSKLIKV